MLNVLKKFGTVEVPKSGSRDFDAESNAASLGPYAKQARGQRRNLKCGLQEQPGVVTWDLFFPSGVHNGPYERSVRM
jgi:hypothetical protein